MVDLDPALTSKVRIQASAIENSKRGFFVFKLV